MLHEGLKIKEVGVEKKQRHKIRKALNVKVKNLDLTLQTLQANERLA